MVKPEITCFENVLVPCSRFSDSKISDEEETIEMYEWLGLAIMKSPRIRSDDDIDPYLSRYQVPEFGQSISNESGLKENIIIMRWHGLIDPDFVVQQFLQAYKAGKRTWFAISAASFSNTSYTLLYNQSQQCFTWECS
jgi:ribonucleases P/MRP protein subunit RPP40